MQEYAITEDWFGIHTFELKIPFAKKKEMNVIFKRIHTESTNNFYYKGDCEVVHTKYPCLRIYLNQKKHMRYIRVVVTANKVLHPEADHLSILNENDDVDLLGMKLDDMLTDIFGDEYGLNRFNLTRIDCCVNVMLSKDFSAERYVKLISRSVNCKADMLEEFDGNDELSKNRQKHSFRVRTSFGAFTAYDKYFQLEDINADFDAVSDALLRIELEFNRQHIHNTIKNCGTEIHNNTEALAFYLRNSRKYFEDFISSVFHNGRYCTVKKMLDIVENSDLRKCEKKHAYKHIKSQCYAEHYCNAAQKSKEKLKSEIAFYNMLENFEYLNMSPISLSYRDKHGDDSVPSLYELLGFEGSKL